MAMVDARCGGTFLKYDSARCGFTCNCPIKATCTWSVTCPDGAGGYLTTSGTGRVVENHQNSGVDSSGKPGSVRLLTFEVVEAYCDRTPEFARQEDSATHTSWNTRRNC